MVTVSEIVQDAFREGNIVAGGAALTTVQETEGLTVFNRFVESLYGYELGEFLGDWPIIPLDVSPIAARYPLFPDNENRRPEEYLYPPPNVRVLVSLQESIEMYLQRDPRDGARMSFVRIRDNDFQLTVVGNGRLIEGQDSITATATELHGRNYMYMADEGGWIRIDTLVATDILPFPPAYDELFVLGTMKRLAPRYGRTLDGEQLQRYNRLIRRMKAQFRQERPSPKDPSNQFLIPASDYRFTRYYDGTTFR